MADEIKGILRVKLLMQNCITIMPSTLVHNQLHCYKHTKQHVNIIFRLNHAYTNIYISFSYFYVNDFFYLFSFICIYSNCLSISRVGTVVAHSTVDRVRGLWFEAYTGLTRISLGTRNEAPRLQSNKM